MAFSKVNVDELAGSGPGGAVRFVRRELGVEAFGINWIELPPDAEGREHDETDTGQEEGDFLRFDPQTQRCPVAGPSGLTILAVGAKRGSYEPRGPF